MSGILARTIHRRAFRRSVMLPCQVVRERDFRLVSTLALDLSTIWPDDGPVAPDEAAP